MNPKTLKGLGIAIAVLLFICFAFCFANVSFIMLRKTESIIELYHATMKEAQENEISPKDSTTKQGGSGGSGGINTDAVEVSDVAIEEERAGVSDAAQGIVQAARIDQEIDFWSDPISSISRLFGFEDSDNIPLPAVHQAPVATPQYLSVPTQPLDARSTSQPTTPTERNALLPNPTR
eukprot:comp7978_c0_seq1/m.8356 comp7978_c0_seq1/g.8356  ORF comp7978_c0_seq1/g.8356 comp7978_c0_seq1/m.8356 type:complete len:178 (+) comp7978_c0_seq1:3-536(+)